MRTAFLQGNEACAYGALAAGCRFFAGYPITPSTTIAETMARELPKVGGVFIQMEDEIASLAAVLGASVGGLKAMTATSGPGFSLMQEHIGYAVMAEIPCVIVDVQRLGPSTGQPTSPSQGDVMQARWGTHGDHPIIALSPTSVRECFDLTVTAFNLSEKYRTPVILLMDAVVGHMREKVTLPAPEELEIIDRARPNVPPEWYFPYEETASDVPPMANFGDGFRYHITGLMHDRAGFPTQRLDEINAWLTRIFRKIDAHVEDIAITEAINVEHARTLVIAYGCTARAAKEAIYMCRRHRVGLLILKTLWPFPKDQVLLAAHEAQRVVVPEMNMGQIALEVERLVGRSKVRRVRRADGEMITPQEIRAAIEYKE
ncbi:MAG: 2-oxoacid:acceptor oxidoreductase subunit alpha [Anaerolineae bacterium]|nr:2-oxoacid:acceptor oxidoreductase subunit alpha [Anaerolineae bacterium]